MCHAAPNPQYYKAKKDENHSDLRIHTLKQLVIKPVHRCMILLKPPYNPFATLSGSIPITHHRSRSSFTGHRGPQKDEMSLQKLLISLAHLLLILCHDCVVESRSRVVSKTSLLSSSSATAATCTNCTICQYPCHTLPPLVPPPGYPLYGAPPPPPPLVTGYPVSGASPPPLPVQGNCPPGQFTACCQYAPPIPYGYGPPNPYGYVPVNNHSAALAFFPSLLWSIVAVLCFIHN